ncbi:hypothetical protein BDV96DRAFT_491269, partial [Lophiotrema nucula]
DMQNQTRCGLDFCAGTNYTEDTFFVCGDYRLGPIFLPTCSPLSSLVGEDSTYHRFGGFCPGEFLAQWTNEAGEYFYPKADGFANNSQGLPIKGQLTLTPGMKIDRFGRPSGSFVAPAGSPYMQRALPPINLDYDPNATMTIPYNYHIYTVVKPISVTGGPVTPWFSQPGFGTQFELDGTVQDYLDIGALIELPVEKECDWLGGGHGGRGWEWKWDEEGRMLRHVGERN